MIPFGLESTFIGCPRQRNSLTLWGDPEGRSLVSVADHIDDCLLAVRVRGDSLKLLLDLSLFSGRAIRLGVAVNHQNMAKIQSNNSGYKLMMGLLLTSIGCCRQDCGRRIDLRRQFQVLQILFYLEERRWQQRPRQRQ